MSTVLPPPSKRQRTDAAEKARVQQDVEEIPSDAGSLRLQFYDEITGLPIGNGPVLVPVADATPKNLELLLNTLQGHVSTALDDDQRLQANGQRIRPNIFLIASRSRSRIKRHRKQPQPLFQQISTELCLPRVS
jgi:hypothetical protein